MVGCCLGPALAEVRIIFLKASFHKTCLIKVIVEIVSGLADTSAALSLLRVSMGSSGSELHLGSVCANSYCRLALPPSPVLQLSFLNGVISHSQFHRFSPIIIVGSMVACRQALGQ